MPIDALIIGGEEGLHRQRIYPHLKKLGVFPKWHWDYKKSIGTKDFPPAADLAIVFSDMVGHVMFDHARAEAKRSGIPLITTTRRRHEYMPAVKEALSRMSKGAPPEPDKAASQEKRGSWKGYSLLVTPEGASWSVSLGGDTLITDLDSQASARKWAKQHERAHPKHLEKKMSHKTHELKRIYRRLGGRLNPVPTKARTGTPTKDSMSYALQAVLLVEPNTRYRDMVPSVNALLRALGHEGPISKHHTSINARTGKNLLGVFNRGQIVCIDFPKYSAMRKQVGCSVWDPSSPPKGVRHATAEDLEWRRGATLGRPRKEAPPPEDRTAPMAEKPHPTPPVVVQGNDLRGLTSADLLREAKDIIATPERQFLARLILGRELTGEDIMKMVLTAGLERLRSNTP